MLAVALLCGGLATSEVDGRARRIEARIGPLVPVVVARTPLRAGARIDPARADRVLEVRQVPERFAPPDALSSSVEAAGSRLVAPVAAGGYLTSGALDRGDRGAGGLGRPGAGERAIDVAVAAGADLQAAGPGARVDVVITSGQDGGRGRSYLALEDVELLAARPLDGQAAGGSGSGDGAAAHATGIATLRVTVRQAVFLAAAQSFAREVRVLVRPPGERRSGTPIAVDGGSL